MSVTDNDSVYDAIGAHRLASAAYDQTVQRWAAANEHDELAEEENHGAFVALQGACQGLVATEVKTLGGLIALLEYMARLLQEPDAPAMPLEVGVDETAFGEFCTNLARSVAAIASAKSTATPQYVDWVADDIIAATGDLFDDYEVVRKVARAAITSVAEYRLERRS
jgi:hypothetical protein